MLVIFSLVKRTVNCELSSLSIALQCLNLKLGLVAIIRAPKRHTAKALSSRRPQIQMLSELQRNLRLLQSGKDHLELNFVAALPHARYPLPLSFFLCSDKRDVAITTLREAIPKFRFA